MEILPFRSMQQKEFKRRQFHIFNPTFEQMNLIPEYYQGVHMLKNRIMQKGITDFTLIGFGSLTRTDKTIRINNQNPQILDSDADFLCIANNYKRHTSIGFELTRKGESNIERQQMTSNAGFKKLIPFIQQEQPFSEHIPFFQVEVLTVPSCLQKLHHTASVFHSFNFSETNFEDKQEERRHLNDLLPLYSHLENGNLFEGTIPPSIIDACVHIKEAQSRVDSLLYS